MASGLRDTVYAMSSQVCSVLLLLATQSVLAWLLGPAGRGSYAVCLVFATMLPLVFSLGLEAAGSYFVASGRMTLSQAFANVMVYGLISSVLAVSVGAVLISSGLEYFQKAPREAFYVSLTFIPVVLFSTIFLQILAAMRDFMWYAFIAIGQAVLGLVLTVLLLVVYPLGVGGALAGMVVALTIGIIAVVIVCVRRHGLRLTPPSLRHLWDMMVYGSHYYVGRISDQFNYQLGMIILAFFLGEAELGILAVATALVTRVNMIPEVMNLVVMPRVAGDPEGRKDLVAQLCRLNSLVCGAILLILVVLTEPIVSILFSKSFLPAVGLIRILAVGVFFRSSTKVIGSFLVGTNHPGMGSISTGVGVVVNLVLLWLLLPVMGLPAAVVALAGGYFAGSALLVFFFLRVSGVQARELVRYRRQDWDLLVGAIRRIRNKAQMR